MDWVLEIFVIYIAISFFFFLFPALLWGKKKYKNAKFTNILTNKNILNIAHRGGPRYGVENTFQLFKKSEAKTDCFQMDVCETADKILVVHHDDHLKRTCGLDNDIEQFRYDDLPHFSKEITLDFGVNKKSFSSNQQIPKLENVLKNFSSTMMNIQLKTPTQSSIKEIVRLLRQHKRVDDTIIGVRNEKNFYIQDNYPDLMVFANDEKVHKILFTYFVGLLPFFRINQTSFQVPIYSEQFEEWNVGRTEQGKKWKIRLFMKFVKIMNFVSRPLVWHLKRRGIITMGWVCNTEQSFENAVRTGVKGIMTDDPVLLGQYLERKGLGQKEKKCL